MPETTDWKTEITPTTKDVEKVRTFLTSLVDEYGDPNMVAAARWKIGFEGINDLCANGGSLQEVLWMIANMRATAQVYSELTNVD